MNFCSECGQELAAGTEKFCPNCGQDLMKGGIRRGGESGSGTVNVNQQELANIQDPEYAKALKDFSENINRQLKGRQIPEEQVKSINTSLEELAKEVQGVKPGREEHIDYPIQLNIESKTVSIVQKTLNVIPEAEEETAATFTPLAPFSKLIGKGVSQIVEDIAKRRKL
jgi:flagellar basal body rod protein FlgB